MENIPTQGIPDYSLIDWCTQYVHSGGTCVDIGAGYGFFSLVMGTKCKCVLAFEEDVDALNGLAIAISSNNRLNVVSKRVSLDEMSLDAYAPKNVDLIRIRTPTSSILKQMGGTLVDNNFPPLILDLQDADTEVLKLIQSTGYRVIPVAGCSGVFLGSDHPFRKKDSPKEDPSEEKEDEIEPFLLKFEAGDETLLEGINQQDQWELLYKIAHAFRQRGNNANAYAAAMKGLDLNPPPHKEYLFYEEISIVAFYLSKKDEGYAACEKVIFSNAPWQIRNYTLNNQRWYMQPLPLMHQRNINHILPAAFLPSSAALVKIGDGYRMNLRTVNYTINEQGGYEIRDPNRVVRTRNFLYKLDVNLDPKHLEGELIDASGVPLYPKDILGIEDLRLFDSNEFFCTYLEVNDQRVPQMCYGVFDDEGHVTQLYPLMVGTELKCEKNWLPFRDDGELKFIYGFSPVRVYRLKEIKEEEQVRMEPELLVEAYLSDDNIETFRGSASPIPYKGGWLFTIHQVYYADPRKYFHRFAWCDRTFTTLKYSSCWYFESPNIEYNLSICHSELGLIITYSIRDNASKLGVVDYDMLDAMLPL